MSDATKADALSASYEDLGRRLANTTTMVVLALMSVLLLIYIAHGNIRRTYEQLLVDKSAAQAEIIRNSIESFVRPGLPLRQYSGFSQLTGSILEGDKTLVSVVVETPEGELVFGGGNTNSRTLARSETDSNIHNDGELRSSDAIMQIVLPLKNKFETVGNLVLTIDRSTLAQALASRIQIDFAVAFAMCALFGIIVFRVSRNKASDEQRAIAVTFTVSFAAVAIAVILSMISVFKVGADSKGQALAASLGERLDDIADFGLQLDQIEGLDLVLDSYRQLNPDVHSIAITVNGRIVVHTDRQRIGNVWSSNSEHSEYKANLTPQNHPRASQVVLSVPRNIVVWTVVRNIKNYAALFVASALFAVLFLQVARVLRDFSVCQASRSAELRSEVALELVRPVFFLAVFVDHLSYAFLPQFIASLGSANSSAVGLALPFTAYYLSFALALVPAGRYSSGTGPRKLVVVGLAMIAIGLFAMSLVHSLAGAVIARAITGGGQGILFIGVQCYVLANARRENRTRSNGIIVYGFQAGMISGMAIGSLLVSEIGAAGVFILAGVVTALAVVYCMTLMPKETQVDSAEANSDEKKLSVFSWLETFKLLRDPQFAQAILLIGLPAKAILTGVILFGMPLLLTSLGFAKEDIGQITMIYAASVILASWIAGHLADRMRTCRTMLASGTLLTAVGLIVIVAAGHEAMVSGPHAFAIKVALIIAGAALIGLAHGLINAPVLTYITETAAAARVGEATAAAGYRFLERIGHMLGPIVVGQLFAAHGISPRAFMVMAAAMLVFATLFHFFNPAPTPAENKEELA